ncbi:TlpA family protein disulfide reductase [Halobacteriovorax sp. GFR7]|uniref:TlpA family protein disulfide reductase n=1 Tax=unclassified Halobacteriovorax TaxID=2639665 RepID=UPI003723A4C3
MKKKWNIATNFISILLVGFIIYKQAPAVLNNFKKEGSTLAPKEYVDLRTNKKLEFPSKDLQNRSLAIFWATWCGPCKVEMKRLHQSVLEGKLSADQIYAINSFENESTIRRFIGQSPYEFRFISSPYAVQALDVKSTPTTILLEGPHVNSMSSGLSFIGIWRAEQYLAKK